MVLDGCRFWHNFDSNVWYHVYFDSSTGDKNFQSVFIPREAEGYSVELFGLSVWPFVRLSPPLEGSIASRLRPLLSPHNDDSYIFGKPKWSRCASQEFVFAYSKNIRRKWRPKVHYMAMSCSRRGPLRHVCGQTINPTAMIYAFGKPNLPRCASSEAFCTFWPKSSKLTSPK